MFSHFRSSPNRDGVDAGPCVIKKESNPKSQLEVENPFGLTDSVWPVLVLALADFGSPVVF